jgi:hypothetical protein
VGGERAPVDPVKFCEPPRDGEGEERNNQSQQECGYQWQPQLGKVSISQGNTTLDADAEEQVYRNCLVEGLWKTQVTFDGNSEKAECESENGR